MADAPPWEWVEGDPVRSRRYSFLSSMVIGTSLAFVAWAFLNYASLNGWLVFPVAPSVLWPLLFVLVFVPLPLILVYYARRFPVIRRLGISPVGLRLVIPPRGFTYRWGEVTRLGTDWLEVHPLLGSQRYRLTAYQAQRMIRFLQPH
ncbi:MAG: hypothetical protein L3K14_04560 [Thermoplasmata archaeon]|nr:hypothetical protein [Thermoplasmata archaeon]